MVPIERMRTAFPYKSVAEFLHMVKTLIPMSIDEQGVNKHLLSELATSFKDVWKMIKIQRCLNTNIALI